MTRLEFNAGTKSSPSVDGTAECPKSHSWAIRTRMVKEEKGGAYGRTYYKTSREVVPAVCPICAERYDAVHAIYFEPMGYDDGQVRPGSF